MSNHAPLQPSLWYDTAKAAPPTQALSTDIEADVCVIGAGFTGLSTGIHLAEKAIKVVVVEAEIAGFGGSGRNAGHCTPTFHSSDFDAVKTMIGEPYATRLIKRHADAALLVFDLIKRYGIECDAVQSGYIEAAHSRSALKRLEKKVADYNSLGKTTRLLDQAETLALAGSPQYFGAWLHPEGGNLNPLGYCRGLAQALLTLGGQVFTETPALSIEPENGKWRVRTPRGSVLADKVVCATGAYTSSYWKNVKKGFASLKIVGMATQPLPESVVSAILPNRNTVLETRHDPASYRISKDLRLVTTIMIEGKRGGNEAFTKSLMTKRFKWLLPALQDIRWEYYWQGELDMQPRLFPRIFELAPGIVTALGFSGRGVPTGTMMGSVLADWASGMGAADMALPVEPLESVPLFMREAIYVVLPWLRFSDQMSARRSGLKPPAY